MSYVTGAHSLKFGYGGGYLVEDIENHGNDLNLAYTFNGGTARSQLTPRASLRSSRRSDRVRNTALYAQDQWTHGRLTLQGALRFDRTWSYSPRAADRTDQTFLATPLTFPETPGVNSTRTSRRAAAWPSTSSATARRP